MSGSAKPSIVFCHGIWADGSCFSKVMPPLPATGYEVMSSQYGLDTNVGDVAMVKRTLDRVKSPAILVGHSYGGAVITAAGTDDRVTGLVYIAAIAPDADETSQSEQNKFPQTDIFKNVEVTGGRVWMRPEGVKYFLRRSFGARSKARICDPLCARCRPLQPQRTRHGLENKTELVHRGQTRSHRAPRSRARCGKTHECQHN